MQATVLRMDGQNTAVMKCKNENIYPARKRPTKKIDLKLSESSKTTKKFRSFWDVDDFYVHLECAEGL